MPVELSIASTGIQPVLGDLRLKHTGELPSKVIIKTPWNQSNSRQSQGNPAEGGLGRIAGVRGVKNMAHRIN